MTPELHWDCPICGKPNIDYFPLPSLECLCEYCGAFTDTDEVYDKGVRHNLTLCPYHADSLGWDACTEGFEGCQIDEVREEKR